MHRAAGQRLSPSLVARLASGCGAGPSWPLLPSKGPRGGPPRRALGLQRHLFYPQSTPLHENSRDGRLVWTGTREHLVSTGFKLGRGFSWPNRTYTLQEGRTSPSGRQGPRPAPGLSYGPAPHAAGSQSPRGPTSAENYEIPFAEAKPDPGELRTPPGTRVHGGPHPLVTYGF